MQNVFNGLKPERVWFYFNEILSIPRPSKKEEKIAKYLVDWAKQKKLEVLTDEIGNVLIRKNAFKGFENRKSVVLQGHMDMVCEKNSDVIFDFDNDSIIPRIVDGWVKATGTTLGADNGIAIAAMLAVLEDNSISHGPLECLITVDEETGLTGAFGLKEDFLKSEILLNLDNEDLGQFCIGCAGGKDTNAFFKYEKEESIEGYDSFKITIKGLKGGHSGDQIDEGLGNSIKLLNRILFESTEKLGLRVADIQGGNLRNAIPREAFANVQVKKENSLKLKEIVIDNFSNFKIELSATEPNLAVDIFGIEKPKYLIDKVTQNNLLNALMAVPHGVMAMSFDIDGLVETSTNLAIVKVEDDLIKIGTSQRSSVASAKEHICNRVATIFKMAGAEVTHTDGYPGWTPNISSEIKNIIVDSYKRLFSKDSEVVAIHAGLECGLIGEKYPSMDMISFGPTIKNPHSPDEKMKIDTVEPFYNLLIDVLKNIPIKK